MRKTLTLMLLVLAASPLAACKMFWERDDKPAAAATVTDPNPAKPDPTAMAEAGKPTTPISPEPSMPAGPATK